MCNPNCLIWGALDLAKSRKSSGRWSHYSLIRAPAHAHKHHTHTKTNKHILAHAHKHTHNSLVIFVQNKRKPRNFFEKSFMRRSKLVRFAFPSLLQFYPLNIVNFPNFLEKNCLYCLSECPSQTLSVPFA